MTVATPCSNRSHHRGGRQRTVVDGDRQLINAPRSKCNQLDFISPMLSGEAGQFCVCRALVGIQLPFKTVLSKDDSLSRGPANDSGDHVDFRPFCERRECVPLRRRGDRTVFLRTHATESSAGLGYEHGVGRAWAGSVPDRRLPQFFGGVPSHRRGRFARTMRFGEFSNKPRAAVLPVSSGCDLCRVGPRMRRPFQATLCELPKFRPIALHPVSPTLEYALPRGVKPANSRLRAVRD